MNLDQLLADAAPPVTPTDPELVDRLDRLVRSTRGGTTTPGRRRVAVVGTVASSVVAVGGLAAAGVLPDVFAWATGSGTSCELRATANPRTDGAGAPTTDAGRTEQRASVASARDYLAGLDLDSIDRVAAEQHWFTYLQQVSAEPVTRAELEQRFSGDRLEVHAMLHEVDLLVADHLRAEGHEASSVVVDVSDRCDG